MGSTTKGEDISNSFLFCLILVWPAIRILYKKFENFYTSSQRYVILKSSRNSMIQQKQEAPHVKKTQTYPCPHRRHTLGRHVPYYPRSGLHGSHGVQGLAQGLSCMHRCNPLLSLRLHPGIPVSEKIIRYSVSATTVSNR